MDKDKYTMKNMLQLTFGEEVANTISHGVMAVFMLVLLPYVSVRSYLQGGSLLVFGNAVFILSLYCMFMASTLYHAMAYDTKHKYVFRVLDHSMIFVAIAGTYTPIALYGIGGKLGWTIFIVQWLMVTCGIIYKSLAKHSIPKLTVTIYMIMGWTALILLPELIRNIGWKFVSLIALGGVLYSIGALFYVKQEKKYYHFIWHIFINLASISHIIAIVFYMN